MIESWATSPLSWAGAPYPMPTIEQDITVEAPVGRAFEVWTDYERFPEFMEHVKEVRRIGPDLTHWVVEAAGKKVEWDAKVTSEENRRVAWRAVGGSGQSGEVRFEPAGANQTKVLVKLDYSLPSKTQEIAASALGIDDKAVKDDLESFKEIVESPGRG